MLKQDKDRKSWWAMHSAASQPCSSGRAHVPEDKKEKYHLNNQIQINQKFFVRFLMAKRLILTFSINYKGKGEIRSIEKGGFI